MSTDPQLDLLARGRAAFGSTEDFHDRRFAAFHAEHPEVYRLFSRFAFVAIRSGREHYSARAIAHRLRWETQIEQASDEDFKVNNNWIARYAKLFMRDHPQHAGFFRTRKPAARSDQ